MQSRNLKEIADDFCRFVRVLSMVFISAMLFTACAHYPVNQSIDQYSPGAGYRVKNMGTPGNSEELFLILTFSGGGTRAAAFSYGLLEELAGTEATIDGRKQRLLDEVDIMSGVSGGSFTAAYYGLFGDRIFEDFEPRFLKKNIQGALFAKKFLFFPNWFRMFSPNFDASDLAAEYYDKHVFEGGTFGDILARGGPAIFINATDMTEGTTFPFIQETFDLLCSDLSDFPVARAAAASSAVPVVLSPITLRNHNGRCGYTPAWIQEALQLRNTAPRRYYQAVHSMPYLDPEKKPYIHLVDGGIADNLGVRVAIDRINQVGDMWSSMKYAGLENIHKMVFIVVNAETGVDRSPDLKKSPAGIFKVLSSVTTTPLSRYNFETIELLKSDFRRWTDDIRSGRCGDPAYKNESGRCDDIEFYLVEVSFDGLQDATERDYFKSLPTSFKLSDEIVDDLREVAGRLLRNSPEFKQLLQDLKE